MPPARTTAITAFALLTDLTATGTVRSMPTTLRIADELHRAAEASAADQDEGDIRVENPWSV